MRVGLRFLRSHGGVAILLMLCAPAACGQTLLDLPTGTETPRPIPLPDVDAPRVNDPAVVPAAVWHANEPEPFQPLTLPAPERVHSNVPPLRLETTAIEDLAAVGQLIPEQQIHPIDLAGALRLAGANDLDIAIARARVAAAVADVRHARALWLPSMFLGPNWIRHDGQVQVVEGPVRTVSKSSLFLGATAAAGSSVSGPVPAGGPA
jgi:hypothetical protein